MILCTEPKVTSWTWLMWITQKTQRTERPAARQTGLLLRQEGRTAIKGVWRCKKVDQTSRDEPIHNTMNGELLLNCNVKKDWFQAILNNTYLCSSESTFIWDKATLHDWAIGPESASCYSSSSVVLVWLKDLYRHVQKNCPPCLKFPPQFCPAKWPADAQPIGPDGTSFTQLSSPLFCLTL